MSCPAVKLLDRYLDGELPSLARVHVRRHLNECIDCRRAWSQLRSLRDRIESPPATPIPNDLTARIMARAGNERLMVARSQSTVPVEASPPMSGRNRHWTQPTFSLASLIGLAVVGLVLGALMSQDMRRETRVGTSLRNARERDPIGGYGLGPALRSSPASLTDVYVTLVSGKAVATRSVLTPAKSQGESP